jgi:hypothetical protein
MHGGFRLAPGWKASVGDAKARVRVHEEHRIAGREKVIVGLVDHEHCALGLAQDNLETGGPRECCAYVLCDKARACTGDGSRDIATTAISDDTRAEESAHARSDKTGRT